MPTVREVTFDLFRKLGMTTIFGNPGSTELPMLTDFPEDFEYVLGLQEAAVVGMADGYAQMTGKPALVNIHTAPGLGNAMGAIFNCQANHSPVVITVGQQVRAQMTMQANLTNRDATRVPHPFVKFSYEPPRAEDVPLALAHAIHLASLPPMGPVMVSLPMDDWEMEMSGDDAGHLLARTVSGRASADPVAVERLAVRIRDAKSPVLVAGPDLDATEGWLEAIALSENQNLPVWAPPAPGGGRIGFPEGHPNFRGVLPPGIQPVGEILGNHDLALVVGSSVFPYYPYLPGKLLHEGTELVQITSDPDEAARAPMGEALVADPKLTLAALNAHLAEPTSRAALDPNPEPVRLEDSDPLNASVVMSILREVMPEDAAIVLEAPSSTLALRNQLRVSNPKSYFFGAGGGLGFGASAAVGVQIAAPDRPVVCVVGEGSLQYAVASLWTATSYKVPVTYLVLRNEEYAILKWFADIENVNSPGLDLPALETAEIGSAYGLKSTRVSGADAVKEALTEAIADPAPRMVEVDVQPGMAIF